MKPTIKQSKISSLIEANVNTFIGFIMSVLLWMYVVPIFYPLLAPHAGLGTGAGLTMIFTVASIGRNYITRRVFNTWVV
jgi:hypothetical protein